jgi:hypothetical protein
MRLLRVRLGAEAYAGRVSRRGRGVTDLQGTAGDGFAKCEGCRGMGLGGEWGLGYATCGYAAAGG